MARTKLLGWNPERTWVFAVGVLSWKHHTTFASFPKENRRDSQLVEFFRAQGVPSDHILYVQDKEATTRRIHDSFEEHVGAAGPNDLLIVYYAGHGDKLDDGTMYLASYDADGERNTGWLAHTIPETLERAYGGSHALLLVDCCYSGCLADVVRQQADRVNYACLLSSLASDLSTGNWTFTEGVLSGLRGQAFVDIDHDNTITLRELAAQIADSLVFADEQLMTFATVGDFDPDTVIAMARPRLDPLVGTRMEAKSEGEWYPAQIIDVRDDRCKVHFYGYEESDDEWVTADRLREQKRQVYRVGTRVEVFSDDEWWHAQVLDVRSGIHHIQYDEWGEDWNEWVGPSRLRERGM